MSPLPLVPTPTHASSPGGAPFRLSSDAAIVHDADAADAAAALRTLIERRTGVRLPSAGPTNAGAPTITLAIDHAGPAESYRLRVDAASVTIAAADAAGLFYGVQSLGQLVTAAGTDGVIPAAQVDDAPRFAYRGVMLDVARHFFGVDAVRAYIERAAALKFNVLHLHLTDDQGWRLQLHSRPALTERASATAIGGDPGGFYTQDEYRDIIARAAAHHMTVVPEIDLPGHTHAVSLAYPELCEAPVLSEHVREVVREYGGDLPTSGVPYQGMAVGFSSLKIHDEATYTFLADVLGEVAALTPGPYLHIGGDEALGTSAADYAEFIGRASALAAATGKTPITWHEAGASAALASGTIGQYWGFVSPTDGADDKARAFAARGGRLILSPADATYLDMKFAADAPLGLTWARGVTSAQRAYEWDAAAVVPGIDDTAILGVEAPLWTETVRTLDDVDALAFPRIAAAAEAAWSPPWNASPERTWDSFRARVGSLGPLWTRLGIRFTALPEIDWTRDGACSDGEHS